MFYEHIGRCDAIDGDDETRGIGRISRVDRGLLGLETPEGPRRGVLTGRLHQLSGADKPAVGDWVRQVPMDGDEVVVTHLLPRRNTLCRLAAGHTGDTQVLAANIDLALLAVSADRDFNLSRLERYLLLVRDACIPALMLLTRSDLHPEPALLLEQMRHAAPDTPALALSIVTGAGFEALAGYLAEGVTAVVLGSSGVGKSSLINHLRGSASQQTGAVRAADGRGRHTTTARCLLPLPGGAVIVDTPGLRELQPLAAQDAVDDVFADVEAAAADCRFSDCRHGDEPGCAVRAALADGRLDARRVANYLKLSEETEAARARASTHTHRAAERRLHRTIRQAKNLKKNRYH